MRIAPHKNPDNTVPRTRRQLLQHIWSNKELEGCDIVKVGPVYSITCGTISTATYVRALDDFSFTAWEKKFYETRNFSEQYRHEKAQATARR